MTEALALPLEPLTAARFAPFGDVLWTGAPSCDAAGAGRAANQGTAVRFDWAAALSSTRPGARPNLAVFRCLPQALPLPVRLLERHPHSSQAFLPLACQRYLVAVAPAAPDGRPDVAGLRAFLCAPGQGVNYHRGVWHHPMIALDAPAEFAMLAWEDGTDGDCEEHHFAAPVAWFTEPSPAPR